MLSMLPTGLQLKLFAVCIAGTGLIGATSVQAGVSHTLSASIVDAGSPVVTQTGASIVTAFYNAPGSSNVTGTALGSATGSYLVHAMGTGAFSIESSFNHLWTITNTSAEPLAYSLIARIYQGGLSVYRNNVGNGTAGYSLSIIRDATDILLASSVTLSSVGSGSVVTSGTLLDGASGNHISYSWNDTTRVLDLGILDAGQSASIEYELIARAGGVGLECIVDGQITSSPGPGEFVCSGGNASLGDPNSLDIRHDLIGLPVFSVVETRIPTVSVPILGTMGLFCLGMGMGLVSLRRNRICRWT